MAHSPDERQIDCSESRLAYYLSKARNVLVQRMDIAVKPLGLTSPQIGVILILAKGIAHTPYEVARAMSIDSGAMTRMLDRLEKKAFITRTRSGEDRRVIELKLTPSGESAARELPHLRDVVMGRQLEGFSADEVKALSSLLARFIANDPALGLEAACTED
jgi:DNA-binding MarR family transcriptional regulator